MQAEAGAGGAAPCNKMSNDKSVAACSLPFFPPTFANRLSKAFRGPLVYMFYAKIVFR